jgi:hypothetical protein
MTPSTAPTALIDRDVVEVVDTHEALDDPLTAIDLGAGIVRCGELRWDAFASSAAEACLARFAADEADVSSADIVGHGRISGVRFPRLGGVLHGRIDPGSPEAALLQSAVERTIRAGYQTALNTAQVARVPVLHDDAEDLWTAFAPASYRIPRRVATTAWEVCRFDDFWVGVLEELGLDGDAARFANGQVSALSRSIRGLSTVGLMLALVERGGRHDRQAARPRRSRRHRFGGRTMPQAPRAIAG